MERLQRVLSSSGIASRRRAEEMIVEGRVRVDGIVVTQLGTQVDAERQKIEVDGKLIPRARLRYIVLNKPSGYITTTADERGRYTVMDLVPVNERVVPVGRLDRQTEGLLLLTNDGEIAHRVMHPRFEIEKEYEALLDGHPPAEVLARVRRGITIDGQVTRPAVVRPMRNTEDGTVVKVVLHEGRNRVVRKMFDEIGYPVLRLIRVRVGPLQLGSIPRGTWRDLTDGELSQLREAVHMTDEDVLADARDAEDRRTGRADVPKWTSGRTPGRGPGAPAGRGGDSLGNDSRSAPLRGPRKDRQPTRPHGRPSGPRRSDDPANRQDRPAPRREPAGPQQRDEHGGVERTVQPRQPGDRGRDGRSSGRPSRPVQRPQRQAEQLDQGGRRTGPAQKPRRPGGGSGKPPIHNRDRRAGGGGKEHGGGDRRPPS